MEARVCRPGFAAKSSLGALCSQRMGRVMRLSAMSAALALSVVAVALNSPAQAVAKKPTAAKQQRVAAITPAKKMATTPAKKMATVKRSRVASAMPVKNAAIAKPRRIAAVASAKIVAFDRHDASGSTNYIQQVPQNARQARADTAGSTGGARMPVIFASADPVSEARRWIGTNPTDRSTLWCARFMNFVLERSGFRGTGSDAASSFASYGQRVSGPQIGAIAVMTRGRNGGHVGIVSGVDAAGNPIIISGNHNKRVGEGTYPRGRVYAYVIPR